MARTGAIANDANSTVDERQLASIGATRGPDGWWYKDGRKLSHDEADRLVQAAGTAQEGLDDWGSGRGWVAETYGRNQKWLAPALTIGAGLINPALGAAVGAATNYERNHNVGKAALAGGSAYLGGKAMQGLKGGAAGARAAGGVAGGAAQGAGGASQVVGGMANASSGGGLPAGLTWGDILKAGGAVAGGISQSNQANANRNQSADQFNRTLALQAGDRAAGLTDRLSRAPLVDKGMYLAQNRAAPTAFQPRDFTRGGFGVMSQQAQGGPTQQLQANAAAAANYRPGMGGYDTSTLEMLRRRMLQQAGV